MGAKDKKKGNDAKKARKVSCPPLNPRAAQDAAP